MGSARGWSRLGCALLAAALACGLALGLLVSALRSAGDQSTVDEYVAMVAGEFALSRDLAASQQRLAVLGTPDIAATLAATAARLAQQPPGRSVTAERIQALALALPTVTSPTPVGIPLSETQSSSPGAVLLLVFGSLILIVVLLLMVPNPMRRRVFARLGYHSAYDRGAPDTTDDPPEASDAVEQDRETMPPSQPGLGERGAWGGDGFGPSDSEDSETQPAPVARSGAAQSVTVPTWRDRLWSLGHPGRGDRPVPESGSLLVQFKYLASDDPYDEVQVLVDPATRLVVGACGMSSATGAMGEQGNSAFVVWVHDYQSGDEIARLGLVSKWAEVTHGARVKQWCEQEQLSSQATVVDGLRGSLSTRNLGVRIRVKSFDYIERSGLPRYACFKELVVAVSIAFTAQR